MKISLCQRDIELDALRACFSCKFNLTRGVPEARRLQGTDRGSRAENSETDIRTYRLFRNGVLVR